MVTACACGDNFRVGALEVRNMVGKESMTLPFIPAYAGIIFYAFQVARCWGCNKTCGHWLFSSCRMPFPFGILAESVAILHDL